MGLLRFILAFGVLLEHANHNLFAGSYTAVQIFFMISGFYMAFILKDKYARPSDFYLSRFFRLYPLYWCAAGFALLYYLAAYWLFDIPSPAARFGAIMSHTTVFEKLWMLVSNLSILGADLSWFLPREGLPPEAKHHIHLLLIPPLWSISLEIYFYLLCPFIMTWRSRTLWTAALALLAIRAALYSNGFGSPPWHVRFFPFELAFFILGILSYRTAERINLGQRLEDLRTRAPLIAMSAIYFAVILAFYPLVNKLNLPQVYGFGDYYLSVALYVTSFVLIPFLFLVSKNWAWDRWIGEFSYPVYLFHYIFVVLLIHHPLKTEIPYLSILMVSGMTLLNGWVFLRFIQKPIDGFRHRNWS